MLRIDEKIAHMHKFVVLSNEVEKLLLNLRQVIDNFNKEYSDAILEPIPLPSPNINITIVGEKGTNDSKLRLLTKLIRKSYNLSNGKAQFDLSTNSNHPFVFYYFKKIYHFKKIYKKRRKVKKYQFEKLNGMYVCNGTSPELKTFKKKFDESGGNIDDFICGKKFLDSRFFSKKHVRFEHVCYINVREEVTTPSNVKNFLNLFKKIVRTSDVVSFVYNSNNPSRSELFLSQLQHVCSNETRSGGNKCKVILHLLCDHKSKINSIRKEIQNKINVDVPIISIYERKEKEKKPESFKKSGKKKKGGRIKNNEEWFLHDSRANNEKVSVKSEADICKVMVHDGYIKKIEMNLKFIEEKRVELKRSFENHLLRNNKVIIGNKDIMTMKWKRYFIAFMFLNAFSIILMFKIVLPEVAFHIGISLPLFETYTRGIYHYPLLLSMLFFLIGAAYVFYEAWFSLKYKKSIPSKKVNSLKNRILDLEETKKSVERFSRRLEKFY